jgi:L1 cell adhesion molecule like protein
MDKEPNDNKMGEDIDNILVDHFATDFNRKYKVDMTTSARSMRRLKSACESAKRTLSTASVANIEIDSLFDGQDLNTSITRAKYESLCSSIFQRTMEPVDQVLKDSGLSKSDINEIVLVGGSTRIPKIQELLSSYFNGKELNKTINPDEAVAYGAAVQAAILSGSTDETLGGLLLLDVTPLSLGVETAGEIMTPIIPRGSTVPTKKTQVFSTAADNQPGCTICVFEGERKFTRDCNQLGKFDLRGIPPMPRGMPQIEITYEVDVNGILNVSACEKSSGKSEKITIQNESSRLSKEDIDRMVEESEKYKAEDDALREKIETKQKLEAYIYQMKSSLQTDENMKQLSDEQKKEAQEKLQTVENWCEINGFAEKTEYETKQKELEDYFVEIMNMKSESESQSQNTFPVEEEPEYEPKIEEID